jgi:hypothetical protein
MQQNPRALQHFVIKMIQWAENVHHKSLNQAALPYAIVILNNVPLQGEDWLSREYATTEVLKSMKTWGLENEGLAKLAGKWNDILPDDKKVRSMGDLFLRYFKDISVIYVPPHVVNSTAILDQLKLLRHTVIELSDEVHKERCRSHSEINAAQFDAYLNGALDHFFTNFDEPFDFLKYLNPPSQSLSEHATHLMRRMGETEEDEKALDDRLIKLISSYIAFSTLSNGTTPS